ncbi:hypothetical protein QBC34DRAFT_4178 [Podospora aff. communis PSN243]|uniref:PHD and RING finger domain-containing protein n=1 Tax=Podospora aff. communis PSN243 TaxID=3040156 RepID=A0AAV9H4D7_9PEZI|nr:hypothetical protein QBC34DRAFT_4178 [Podospora aff. communis PSN243]
MADQCIVCLENLDVESSAAVAALAATVAPQPQDNHTSSAVPTEHSSRSVAAGPVAPALDSSLSLNSIASPKQHENHDHVAQIQICGHVLHDSCLREWTEKANSCPICRQTFNLVHVYDKVGGTLLSTRTVEDKKQVAEFDPHAWIDENPEEEEAQIPCPVCNRADQEEVLLLCDGCDTPYHTHCIGLDSVPLGPWFCMECVDALGIENPDSGSPLQENQDARERLYYFPRTQASMRRARQRARSDEWQGAWGRIAGRIWDALSIDLDYQDDDDQVIFEGLRRSQQIRERERLEHERWQQRLNIASRMGAREVFARNIPSVLTRAVPATRPPPQESREVQLAWGALERARESENRKRKSRSATAEPSEPQHEPERKLKRPRTRRLPPHQNGESSTTASNAGPISSLAQPENPAPAAPAAVPAPSFLSSLLKEVEMSTPSDEERVQALYGRVPGANDVSPSVVGSPSRASSITPPPSHAGRPSSPPTMTLSSRIEPIYPRANYSPTRSTSPNKHNSRSSSPSKRPAHECRSSPENSDSERRGRSHGNAELRQPRPRRTQPIVPPRSENVSPVRTPLPLEVKENISSIVRSALNPHWKSSKLTSEQYAAINRDISRKIYEQVQDPAAVGDDARRSWETMASQEVARAVADLRA